MHWGGSKRIRGGPSGKVRRLHANVVYSIVLYGAPVWAAEVATTEYLSKRLRQFQRKITVRTARCYCTASYVVASLLASSILIECMANERANIYWKVKELRGRGVPITQQARRTLRDSARRRTLAEWRRRLSNPQLPSQRLVVAARPVLLDWMEAVQRHGMTFRLA